MKIINQFKKLQKGSKITLRYRKYQTELFLGNDTFEFGVCIKVSNGKVLLKEYDKFTISCEQNPIETAFFIKANIDNDDELVVFSYLIEYILFELSTKIQAKPKDIKKHIDDWLNFSKSILTEISIEKQIGLIGELVILNSLTKEIERTNQLNNWHGPEGAKIDFIFSEKFGLEVKSRIQPFKDWIMISSAEQLDNEMESQHLVVCDFLPSDTGKTLKQYADEVMLSLDDRDLANDLIDKLRKAKFDYFTDYSNLIKVNLFRKSIYDVKDDNFPILKNGVDVRIDKIKYEINISGINTIEFTQTLTKVRSQQELS
jgi:hypothetical protein